MYDVAFKKMAIELSDLTGSMKEAAEELAGDTTVAAFKMAAGNRAILQPLLFHSDRSVKYACGEFRLELKKWPVK